MNIPGIARIVPTHAIFCNDNSYNILGKGNRRIIPVLKTALSF
jgi:hypothetical protein